MRIDRLLTLCFFYPAIKVMGRSSGLQIPILMYHGISDHINDHLHPYYRTVTTIERFEQHMRFLIENRYQVITLSEAARLLQEAPSATSSSQRKSTPEKSANHHCPMVVITFDDGLRNFYTAAFPVLEKFGFKATVFLTSGLIGKTFPNGSDCLKDAEIKELTGKGIEFGSHTVSHPQLKKLSLDEIGHELSASKTTIEAITGSSVTLFSYPYKFPEENQKFTKKLTVLLASLGYIAEVTTIIGTAKRGDNLFFLKRLPMNNDDDLTLLQAKLEGGYDWLHNCQLVYKKITWLFTSCS